MKINVLLIALLLAFNCQAQFKKHENHGKAKPWIMLFDGKNTDALRGYMMDSFPTGIWEVANGNLTTNPAAKNVDLITKQRFKNFEMEYEWAVDKGANSGVFFFMQEDAAMVSGNGNSPNWLDNYEIQVLDDINFKDTAAIRSAGSLYDLIRPKNKKLMPIGEFNQAKLSINGNHVEHWLNGVKVLEFELNSQALQELIWKSKFKGNLKFAKATEGHIMFQHHGQKVYYKNIRVREL